MSLSKDVPSSFLIAPDLLHDPRANYPGTFPGKQLFSSFKLAASQLPALSASGGLFLVQTHKLNHFLRRIYIYIYISDLSINVNMTKADIV
jgi:hypothetical protein